jgi:hypothetical protein
MRALLSFLVKPLAVSVRAVRGVARMARRPLPSPRPPLTYFSRWFRRAPLLVGIVVALVTGLGAGTAFAFFEGSGSGSKGATIGTPAPVTVLAATGTPSTELIPGGTADLTLTLDNPNSYPVVITGISQDGSVTVSGGIGTCSTTGVSVPTQSGLSYTVQSGSTVVVHIANGAAMATDSDSGCQGASFEVPVTITVEKG